MSYAVSPALQKAVYEVLSAHGALAGLVGTDIFDAPPSGVVPGTYVSLGPERVLDRSDASGRGAQHDFTVSVVTNADGFQSAKEIAGAVNDALAGPFPPLDRGKLVWMGFLRAQARREQAGQIRRIDLTFRARVDDT